MTRPCLMCDEWVSQKRWLFHWLGHQPSAEDTWMFEGEQAEYERKYKQTKI